MNNIKPSFFIIGGPKCGTSSLFAYLEEHPDICMSLPKETHYFYTDLPRYRQASSLEQYLNMFSPTTNHNSQILGEGSTWYLFSDEALKNIIDFNPDSKIIIMIRNPLQVVVSLYLQFVYSHEENAKTFQAAWDLQSKRKKGLEIPDFIIGPDRLQYSKVAAFGSQVERALNIVPENQLKVILFDDFITNTSGVYKDVLTFLELKNDNRTHFQRENERKAHRFKSIALLTRHSQPLNKIVKFIKNIFGIKSIGLSKKLNSINTKKIKKETLSYSLAKEMHEVFDPDIIKLEQLLNINLSQWKEYGLNNNDSQ